jgi:hypothetical protein
MGTWRYGAPAFLGEVGVLPSAKGERAVQENERGKRGEEREDAAGVRAGFRGEVGWRRGAWPKKAKRGRGPELRRWA